MIFMSNIYSDQISAESNFINITHYYNYDTY